jgi:hypothetical protein
MTDNILQMLKKSTETSPSSAPVSPVVERNSHVAGIYFVLGRILNYGLRSVHDAGSEQKGAGSRGRTL